jgi:hypothetical protein
MSQRRAKHTTPDLPDMRDWFSGTFFAVPSDMAAAVAVAASKSGLTVAEYLRRAVYLRMSADGIRVDDIAA